MPLPDAWCLLRWQNDGLDAKLPQLEETAADNSTDVLRHSQLSVYVDAEILYDHDWQDDWLTGCSAVLRQPSMASRNSFNVSSSRSSTSLHQFDVVFGVRPVRPPSGCRPKPTLHKESVVVSSVAGCPPETNQIVSGIDALAVQPTKG